MMKCDLCHSETPRIRYALRGKQVFECTCGLIFSSRVPEDLQAIYDAEEFWFANPNLSTTSGVGYDERDSRVRLWRRELAKVEQWLPPGKVLDIGCAKGVFLDVARKRGWEPFGVEISQYASHYAMEAFGLPVFTGTLEEAGFEDEIFDLVTMWDVIEHLISPSQTVAEIWRILKGAGLVLISTPNQGSLLHRLAGAAYRLGLKSPAQHIYHDGHLYYFSERALRQLLSNLGFEILWVAKDPHSVITIRWEKLWERAAARLDETAGRWLRMPFRLLMAARKTTLPISSRRRSGARRGEEK